MRRVSGSGYGFTPADARLGELSRDAVDRARARFSRSYDRVLDNVNVTPHNWWQRFLPVEQQFDELAPWERGPARQIVDDFRDQIQNLTTLSGRDYKRMRSSLGDKANKARNNPQYNGIAQIYRGLRDTLDEGFRDAAPAAVTRRLRELDRNYGGWKHLTKAADNPEAIGTFANNVRRNAHRLPRDYVDLVEAYQDVILRGYPRSSMTPEGLTFGNLPLTIAHAARASTAPVSRAYENARRSVIPAPGQRAPQQRRRNAAIQRNVDPILQALRGATPFIAGQQTQNTPVGALPAALLGADQ
jgi:hypothetical protein